MCQTPLEMGCKLDFGKKPFFEDRIGHPGSSVVSPGCSQAGGWVKLGWMAAGDVALCTLSGHSGSWLLLCLHGIQRDRL